MERDTEVFELFEELGHGAFACTYRARVVDPDLREDFGEEIVAIKVPHGRREEHALRRELELNAGLHMRIRKLRSPNLVRYLGFTQFRNRIVMVMEYMPEGSVRHMLRRSKNRRLSIGIACPIAQGILQGLALLHGEEIFHRDIKPENILMGGGTPKIADLGIARLIESGELAVTQTGTLPYMSPELLSSAGASYSADLWAVGVMLYEMLTAVRPFGDSATPIRKLMDLICNAQHMPASVRCADVPRVLSDVIDRALRKDPADRFADAESMSDALTSSTASTELPLDDALAEVQALLAQPSEAAEAEKRLRNIIQRHPTDTRAYQHLAELLTRSQQHRAAARMLEQAIAFDSNDPALHWQLALALQATGDMTGAAEALRKALASNRISDALRGHAHRLLHVIAARSSR